MPFTINVYTERQALQDRQGGGHGTEYKCPVFSKIKGIIIDANNEAFLIFEPLTTVKFYRHVHSYEVECNSFLSLFAITLDSLVDPHCMSFHSYSHTQSRYISPKYSVVHCSLF